MNLPDHLIEELSFVLGCGIALFILWPWTDADNLLGFAHWSKAFILLTAF